MGPIAGSLVPRRSEDDAVFTAMRVALSLASAGVAGELFSLLVRAPFDKRMEEWCQYIEDCIRSLYARDRTIEAHLQSDEFVSVLLTATQSAVRTHKRAKRELLGNAVQASITGSSLPTDMQLLFIRFVDELTLTHIMIFAQIRLNEAAAAECASYEQLFALIVESAGIDCRRDQFTLFCNDLQIRALVRFSEVLDGFPGLAETSAIVTEASGTGPKVAVSQLGSEFLEFIKNPAKTA
ncbi:MAG: hypothetical protein ABIR59_13125 [Gemmatimonadales bacterium]